LPRFYESRKLKQGGSYKARSSEIGVEPFLRVELRAVTGQIEQLDLISTPFNPSLDRLAVMDSQVIENQKHFFPASWIKACKNSISLSEFNESSMIIQSVLPLVVTVAIIDSFWRVPPTANVTGVLPSGA
jgi:hypothetical protein